MAISYNKDWKILIDKKISKEKMRKAKGISTNTKTKLNRDEEVTLSVLCKICDALNSDFGDIIEYIPTNNEEDSNEKEN